MGPVSTTTVGGNVVSVEERGLFEQEPVGRRIGTAAVEAAGQITRKFEATRRLWAGVAIECSTEEFADQGRAADVTPPRLPRKGRIHLGGQLDGK